MGKSRKSQGYQDPLDSIFGFIFGNAKSKPVKTRPTKIRPGNASQELARGLAEIAATPGNFVNDIALGSLGEGPGSVTIAEVGINAHDPKLYRNVGGKKFDISGGDLIEALKDPNKYVDKKFSKSEEERRWARYLNTGRGLDTALLAIWAKKQGFNSKEAANIGFASSNFLGPDQTLEARKKYAQNMTVSFLHQKGVSNGQLRDVIKGLEQYSGDNIRSEADLKNILSGIPAIASRGDFNTIVSDMYSNYSKGIKADPKNLPSVGKAWGSHWQTDGKINRDGYISILRENLGHRAGILDATDPAQAAEQRKLLATQQALDNVLKIKGPGFDGININAFQSQVSSVHSQIESCKANMGATPTTAQKNILSRLSIIENDMIKEAQHAQDYLVKKQQRRIFGFPVVGDYSTYKKFLTREVDAEIEIANLGKIAAVGDPRKTAYFDNLIASLQNKQSALQTAPFRDWRITIADVTGAYRSIDGNILKGNLVKNFLTGDLYRDAYMRPGTFEKFKITSGRGGQIMTARNDISFAYAGLSNLYYFTPGSVAKTLLFNGEGFSKLLFNQRSRDLSKFFTPANQTAMLSVINADKSLLDALKEAKFLSADGKSLDMQAILAGFPDFFEKLESKKSSFGGLWGTFQALHKKDQNGIWAVAAKVFGTPEIIWGKIDGFYQKAFGDKFKTMMGNVWKKVLGEKLGSKVIGLGLRQAVSVIVSEVLVSLGIAVGGPIGATVAYILTALGEGIVNKALKPMIKLFMLFLWSIILVLIAVLFLVIGLFHSTYLPPQGHLAPLNMIECTDNNAFESVYKYTPQIPAGNYGTAPAGSKCPIIADTMRCTQGDGAGSSGFHQSHHSLDIGVYDLPNTVWYAPTDGTVISYTANNGCPFDGSNYGGTLVFQDSEGNLYTLTHISGLASGAVSKGKPVARALGNGEIQPGGCWDAPHFHLDVQVKGEYVDAETWYKDQLKCNIVNNNASCNP